MAVLPAVALVFALVFAGQSAQADWGVSFYGEVRDPGYTSYGDRITSEYRRGYQVDDWIERGESSVTESPIFSDGIRLAAWATRYEEDYDFALASGIYFFEIPPRARSIRVKISYEGDADRSDFEGDIAGRVWVRRARLGDDYEEYYPSEGRYEDADQPLYGDTFVLRANKHLEIIRMSAEDHEIDGMMELHLVTEGQQRLDVKYIEVETYSYLPSVRVITRYQRDYVWRPWYDYTYWYFYTGPTYHFADYYYVKYTYPRYHRNYISIRKRYNDYLHVYYVHRPHRHVRSVNVVRVSRGTPRTWSRDRLSRWTSDYEDARKVYRVTSTKTRRSADVQKTRTRVRSVLSSHSRPSPAAIRARSSTVTTPSQQRGTTSRQTRSDVQIRSRSSGSPPARVETRTRTGTQRSDIGPSVRTRSSSSSRSEQQRSVRQAPARSTSQEKRRTTPDTKTRREDVRSSVRTRSSSSSRSEQQRSVRQAPTGSSSQEERETTPDRSKVRRESSKSRTPGSSSSSSVRRSPSRSESQKRAPSKVETKKDDDDDDDEDDEKKSRSSSTRSSSSSKTRTRTR
jgi:hypothetical protein